MICTSIELAVVAGLQHRSVQRMIQKNAGYLAKIDKISSRMVKSQSGQMIKCYSLEKGHISYLVGKMKRKATIDNIIEQFDIDSVVIKDRLENDIYKTISAICDGFDNDLTVLHDFKIGSYRVDMAVFVDNVEINNLWLIVEYDEGHHKYSKKADKRRELEIFNALEDRISDLDAFYIIRIKQGDESRGITDVVRFLNSNILNLHGSDTYCLEKFKITKKQEKLNGK